MWIADWRGSDDAIEQAHNAKELVEQCAANLPYADRFRNNCYRRIIGADTEIRVWYSDHLATCCAVGSGWVGICRYVNAAHVALVRAGACPGCLIQRAFGRVLDR